MEQFNLEKYLENPSRKVVTRDGRIVRIICWDAKNSRPIVALVSTRSISQRQFDELTISYFNDGTYYGGTKEDFLDLFFADEEIVDTRLKKLNKECYECCASGSDPCRGCETNTQKNELLKHLSK